MASAVPNAQKMKFTKTEREYDMKSIRFLLLTITTMFIIIGGLMIVLGISVYSHYHSFDFFYESAKSGRFLTPSVLSVFLGFVLLVVTSFGFFGSLKQSTCMVNLYALILGIILVVKLVVVILAFTIDHGTMMRYVYFPVAGYTTDPEIQDEIDSLQTTLNCCGGDSYLDYIGMTFTNQSTTYISTEVDGNFIFMEIPDTCCIVVNKVCTRLRTAGCKEALVSVLIDNAGVLGVLGVSVMFIIILGIVFALLLARCIRRLKSERALLAWKIKEQMIIARQEERRKAEFQDQDKESVYIDHPESSVA